MKAAELREQTDEELKQLYDDAVKAFFDLKIKRSGGDSSEQPLLIRERRRDVARILTVMRERSIAGKQKVLEHSV